MPHPHGVLVLSVGKTLLPYGAAAVHPRGRVCALCHCEKAEAVAPSLAAADEDMEVEVGTQPLALEPWSKKHWNQQI